MSNRHAGSSKLYAKWERAEEQRVRGEGIGPSGRMCCIRLGGEDSSKEVALEWILDRSERTIRVKIWGALQAARSVGTEVRRQQQVWFVRGAARRAWPEQSGKKMQTMLGDEFRAGSKRVAHFKFYSECDEKPLEGLVQGHQLS